MNLTGVTVGGLHFLNVLLLTTVLHTTKALPKTDTPVVSDYPFLFMWNAPTELCETRFSIGLDLSYFQLVSSTLKTATNQSISIFYTDRFGIFPYVDEDTGEMYDEGLPQLIDFQEHRELAEDDIEYYIPKDQPGLAILDFEEWRPQWIRNWGSKDIYRQMSIEIVKTKNPLLSDDEAEDRAKMVFEKAAKRYFIRSLRLGIRLRPNRLWGYYLYPDCYNYDYNQDKEHYSGSCPDIEKERNDELMWLWKESTALFPSIYLELILRDSYQARLYVRHRIQEAMRVSVLPNQNYSIPVYAYIRPVYKDSIDDYMSEYDLVNTVGEAAALGAAGVVSWGDMNVTDSEDSCFNARQHLDTTMNPYILNVSMATRLCSEALCQAKGRCVRKIWDRDDYLHLDPQRYQIKRYRNGELAVKGEMSQEDVDWFAEKFDCLCYSEDPCQFPVTLNTIPMFKNTQPNHSNNSHLSNVLLLAMIGLSMCFAAM
ncbi:hyaluronidase-5-like [Osmerus mordax]|uniref:hyaluronidase-5-like n=1 Tax=Osmerus mordax TaxID=8014 RepID=UPI00350F5940